MAGAGATIEPYPAGTPGIRMSIDAMAAHLREALTPAGGAVEIRDWSVDCLHKAKLDGRDLPGVRKVAQAIVDGVRAQTIYLPDSHGTEWIQAPRITLCLKDRCIRGGDCDDLFCATASALQHSGIPIWIVRQQFGPNTQEHVLIGMRDGNTKLYVDPSTKDPVYTGSRASTEEWIDPLGKVGELAASGAHLVTLGAPRDIRRFNGWWLEKTPDGRAWASNGGPWQETTAEQFDATPIGFGDTSSVSVGDVLAYRQTWDSYIAAVVDAYNACGDAWMAQANGTAPATSVNLTQFKVTPDATTLKLWANSQYTEAQSIAASWNQYGGNVSTGKAPLTDAEIVMLAPDILRSYQKQILSVGGFYVPQLLNDCPATKLPEPPTFSVQAQIIGRIEALGILAHGELQLIGTAAGGALDTYGAIGQTINEAAHAAIDASTRTWPYVAASLIAVAVTAYYTVPVIRAALPMLQKPKPTE